MPTNFTITADCPADKVVEIYVRESNKDTVLHVLQNTETSPSITVEGSTVVTVGEANQPVPGAAR